MLETTPGQISCELVTKHLDRILESQTFAEAQALRRFLKFIVSTALQNNQDRIKEYILGTEVFGRRESFDPRIDPIVRVEARRLRAKLDTYYETEGRNDKVLIHIPKGSYIPLFSERQSTVLQATLGDSDHERDERGVAVLPFLNLSSEIDSEVFTDGVTEELISALTTIGGLHVIPQTSVLQFKRKGVNVYQLGKILKIRMVVEGSVRKANGELRIRVRLIDSVRGYNIWSQTYNPEMKSMFTTQQQVCETIAEALKPKLLVGYELFENGDTVSKVKSENNVLKLKYNSA
jgi:adenylate cyclase